MSGKSMKMKICKSATFIALLLVAKCTTAQQMMGGSLHGGSDSSSTSAGAVPTMTTNQQPAATSVSAIITPRTFLRTNLTQLNPNAICNDGTPGFYYFRQGTGNGTNKWVILFEGGGFCSDQQTCTQRAVSNPSLMGSSTQNYPDVLSGAAAAGVLDGDLRANPNMYTWNHVWVGYCSSDSFLGNAGPGDNPEAGVFTFKGQTIANTTILSLLGTKNLRSATDVLIVGVSAGAVGVLNLVDGFYSLLQQNAPALGTFKAFIDAGWFLDLPSYSTAASAFTFRKTAVGLYENFKATFQPSCTAAYPSQPWACFFAQYGWAYVRTPLIFHENLYDGASLGFDAAGSQDDINDFRTRLTASVTTAANNIPAIRNDSSPSASVSTKSIGAAAPPPAVAGKGVSSLPTLNDSQPGSVASNGLSEPIMQSVPPAPFSASLSSGSPGPSIQAPGPLNFSSSPGLPSLSRAPIGSNALPAVFAPACNNHNIADNDLFAVSHIGRVKFLDVLDSWFTSGSASLPLLDPTVGQGPATSCLRATS